MLHKPVGLDQTKPSNNKDVIDMLAAKQKIAKAQEALKKRKAKKVNFLDTPIGKILRIRPQSIFNTNLAKAYFKWDGEAKPHPCW